MLARVIIIHKHGTKMLSTLFFPKISRRAFSALIQGKSLHGTVPTPFTQFNYAFQVKRNKQDDHRSDENMENITVTENEISNAVLSVTKKHNLRKEDAISLRLGLRLGVHFHDKSQFGVTVGQKFASGILQPDFLFYIIAGLSVILLIILLYAIGSAITSSMKKYISVPKDFKAEIPDVAFDDVKGIDEVKQELIDIVEFLKDPERFTNLGARLPKGTLLVGPPGTGKTLLARAIAGEAGVPFYYAAGSEFDEMFVGVGSRRIRSLFADARDNAPCIIFIDEIDACGNTRSSSQLRPYARMTINQLLQEMDGFEGKEGIIVLGATNMREVLDKALTRPGRFDSEVKVLPPDIRGRKEILELYVKKIICSNDLDLDKIAQLTSGMTGADLFNLVNNAALRAAKLQKFSVDMQDFEYAFDKLKIGLNLKSKLRTVKELENTAFHEAGHALVAFYTSSSSLFKVTIGQRGHSLGHTSMIPDQEDENNLTKAKILGQIDISMGGRVAEELLSGAQNVTTGAAQDLEIATTLAYQLVCDFGMTESLGMVTYDLETVSPKTKRLIEIEVNDILNASYNRAKQLLLKHKSQHVLLVEALLKYETLNLEEIKTLFLTNSIESLL